MNVQRKIELSVLEYYLGTLKNLIVCLKIFKTKYSKLQEELLKDLQIDLYNLDRLITLMKNEGKEEKT